jgi:integrase
MWQVTDAESILFVPKPTRRVDCQRQDAPDLGTTVRQRPLASAAGGGDCYSLGYSAPGRLRLGHLDANYRHDPDRGQTVQPDVRLAVIVDELIGSNPVERAKRPRAQAQEPGTVWTVTQLRAFLSTARQHRLFAFFHVAAYTGARRGELLNLQWKDIDLDGKKITITGSTAVIGGERVNGTTKSGRTRVVSIDDETVTVLRQRKADQAAEQLKAGDSWHGTRDGYVFTTGWASPSTPIPSRRS